MLIGFDADVFNIALSVEFNVLFKVSSISVFGIVWSCISSSVVCVANL